MTAADTAALADQLTCYDERLEAAEQRAQLSLFRLLAKGTPVSTARLAGETGQSASEIERRLDSWHGVQTRDGEVVAFQGLSLIETPHRLRGEGRVLYTWCAWDTLFLPELLGRSAEVESTCPTTGDRISLRVDLDGPKDIAPADAVLSFRNAGPIFADGVQQGFCRFAHFFASAGAAGAWIAAHPDTLMIWIATGFEIGRRTNAAQFGSALDAMEATA